MVDHVHHSLLSLPAMRFKQISDEIREKRRLPPHRAVYDIYNLLNNNKAAFSDKIEAQDLKILLNDLENLSESHPRNYGTPLYEREAEQVLNRLMFFLDRMF
jgi:hypothetical protein